MGKRPKPQLERTYRPRRLVEPFDWSMSGPVRGLRSDLQELVLFPIVRAFARIDCRGKEHLKEVRGPVVLVSNHTSHFDCPVILTALPHRIRQRTIVAAAADYFYKVRMLGALTSLALGTIPFERHEDSQAGLERCKEGLRRGWNVLIFPEGTRSTTGGLAAFRRGAAHLCLETKCAAVPIHIRGAHNIMPKGATMPKPGRVEVRFGALVHPEPGNDPEALTKRLHDAVAALEAEA